MGGEREGVRESSAAYVDGGKSHHSTFARHGIATEALPLAGRAPSLLLALDRLLAVTRATPGAIALHCRPGPAARRSLALVAAYLARGLGFPPDAAVAWIRMAHPALFVPAHSSLGRPIAFADGWKGVAGIHRCESLATPCDPERPRAVASWQGGGELGGVAGELRRAASCPVAMAAPDVFDLC